MNIPHIEFLETRQLLDGQQTSGGDIRLIDALGAAALEAIVYLPGAAIDIVVGSIFMWEGVSIPLVASGAILKLKNSSQTSVDTFLQDNFALFRGVLGFEAIRIAWNTQVFTYNECAKENNFYSCEFVTASLREIVFCAKYLTYGISIGTIAAFVISANNSKR